MPGAVVDAGLASAVLSLPDIAAEIVKKGVSGRESLETLERRVEGYRLGRSVGGLASV